MKLWILRPVGYGDYDFGGRWEEGPWDPWYDKAFGFVVIALNERAAREWAASRHGNEAPYSWKPGQSGNPWMDPSLTECKELTADTFRRSGPGVVLADIQGA